MELSIVLLSVVLVWGIAVVTPGPNFFITIQLAIIRSRRSALFAALGITSGTLIWAVTGFFGINFLFKTVPWVYFSLKLLGGTYLIYLGIKLLRSKSIKVTEEHTHFSAHIDLWKSYKTGLLTNLSNPKTAAFVTSLFAAAIPPDASYSTGFISVAFMALISISWYSFVACIFSLNRFRIIYQRFRIWIERVAGLIFIGFGVKLSAG